jgi:hypothetical protein
VQCRVKGNCSFSFIRRGHLCLLPLVTGLLILVANCPALLGTPEFMRLTLTKEWGFCEFATSVLVGFGPTYTGPTPCSNTQRFKCRFSRRRPASPVQKLTSPGVIAGTRAPPTTASIPVVISTGVQALGRLCRPEKSSQVSNVRNEAN